MNSTNLFAKLGLGMIAVLSLSSCVKENMESMPEASSDLMTISISTEIDSKTTLNHEGRKLSWTAGDKFDLFSNVGETVSVLEFADNEANFEAQVDQGATEVYAVYPSVAGNTNAEVSVEIPAVQTQPQAGKLNGNNVPMYAKGIINEGQVCLLFRPKAGIIALNVYSTDATAAKVTKVQVNPLDKDGNLVYKGYCGVVKTSADEFEYAPEADDLRGVTLTLGTPCSIPAAKPADDAATIMFENQLYIALARGTYEGLQFIVTTDDGKMYVARSKTQRSFSTTDVHFINLNLAGKDEISDDFYGQYNAGLDLTICGNVINKKTHPKAQVKTMGEITWPFLAKPYSDEIDGGILLIDNSGNAYKATAATRPIGKDRIIIGRYRNANQPIFKINSANSYMWTLDGRVMLKNITLSSFQTTRCLFLGVSGAAHGVSEFYFEDCTLTNTNTSYGIFTELDASCAVPKSMRFDNCILRANTAFFGVSGRKTSAETTETNDYFQSMQHLKSLTFNDCVFAPATLAEGSKEDFAESVTPLNKMGVLAAMYHPNYKFDELEISYVDCSFYEVGPDQSQAPMVYPTTLKRLHLEYCVFSYSAWVSNAYLLKVLAKCPEGASYSGKAVYTNTNSNSRKLAVGPATELKNFAIDRSLQITSIANETELFGECEPAKHYFPVSKEWASTLTVNSVGASYDTKYWVVPTQAAK